LLKNSITESLDVNMIVCLQSQWLFCASRLQGKTLAKGQSICRTTSIPLVRKEEMVLILKEKS